MPGRERHLHDRRGLPAPRTPTAAEGSSPTATQWRTAGAGLCSHHPPDQHCLVRPSLTLRSTLEIQLRRAVHHGCVRSRPGPGPAITLLCPCPGVCAPQLASKPPATRPHNTTRCTVSLRSHPPAEQRGYEVTRGKVVCCERLARQWHARGQGFKSPQLHQAQRIFSLPSEHHLPEICQSLTARVGQDPVSADRFR